MSEPIHCFALRATRRASRTPGPPLRSCVRLPPRREFLRVGARTRQDRLLLIADRENRARQLPCALAGEELLAELLDDVPLARACVLRLVDQHVIDTHVEPVM